MKKTQTKTIVFWLFALILVSVVARTALAATWAPAGSARSPIIVPGTDLDPETFDIGALVRSLSKRAPASDSSKEPLWVPTGAGPGFYAARDWRDLDAATHGFTGGHQSFYWDQLEPTEGNYNWDPIETFVLDEIANGKKAAIGIITFNGRANEGRVGDPPIRVPQFVFSAGAAKITAPGDANKYPGNPGPYPAFEIPKYWDPIYLAKYEAFVTALANQYDGDSRIEFIQIGVGKFGETQPSDDFDDTYVEAALVADGKTQWSWAYIVNDITDIYDRHFQTTRLVLTNAPTFMSDKCGFRVWTDHAASVGIGLFPAGLMPIQEAVDYRPKPGWDGCGKFDQILTHHENYVNGIGPEEWVPLAQEAYNYMSPTAIQFHWAVLGALSRRIDYITCEYDLLYDPSTGLARPDFSDFVSTIRWASPYMGKHLSDSPSAWVALREAGYKDNWYPQRGNYSWWLYQDDSVAGGRTRVTTYRTKRELVHSWDYDTYGEAATVRAEIEISQTFLGPSKEGWIARRTDQGTGNRYMWFNVDDRYHYGSSTEATITVTYFDRGTDTWQLVYDAAGDANKVARTVTKANTNTWKQEVVTVGDAWFGNRQTGSMDFRIDSMSDGDEHIHMVDVNIAGGAGVTATPTNTLDPGITATVTPTPTDTATATITPTPTETPSVTPTPVVADYSATKDTYLDAWYPTDIHGSDQRLNVGRGLASYRPLIYFDLSSIPTDATISVATLNLYLDYYEHLLELSPSVSVHRVKQDWEELQATWDERSTGAAWDTAGCEGSGDREASSSGSATIGAVSTWYQWDVGALVQDWVWYPTTNKGMLLLPASGAGRWLRFHSMNTGTNTPRLHVEYTVGGVPGSTRTATPTPTETPSVVPTSNYLEFRNASKDTYIDIGRPDASFEGSWLHVKGSGWERSLLDFDISVIPGDANIVTATLRLTASDYDDGRTEISLNVGAYAVNRSWVANSATWLAASTGSPWGTVGCDSIPGDRDGTPADVVAVRDISEGTIPYQRVLYDWDVSSIVQDWVDNPGTQQGLVLLSDDGSFRDVAFYDTAFMGSAGDELHPLLMVYWLPRDATPTPTATATVTATPTTPSGGVAGTVYGDLNGSGTRDAGELGIMGATVRLLSGQAVIDQQTTAGSGTYGFNSVPVGSYQIRVSGPTGYVATSQNPVAVSITADTVVTADFGVIQGQVLHLPLALKYAS